MKKIITIIIVSGFVNLKAFSQELPVLNQRDSVVNVNIPSRKVNQLDLTKTQKKQFKQCRKTIKCKKTGIKNNTSILTPEQKKKMVENNKVVPRRGVTNLPNERTGQ